MHILNWEIVMPNESSSHLGDEEIEIYSGGKTTQAQEEAWEEHLLLCEACRERLESTEVFNKAMKSATAEWKRSPKEIQGAGWTLSRLFPAFPAVAALAAAALILAAWFGWGKFGRAGHPGDSTPAVVTLHAVRGSLAAASAPAGRPIALHLDVTALPSEPKFRLEIVGVTGDPVWAGDGTVNGQDAAASVPAEKPGSYFVRLYSPTGDLLREYALEVGPPE